MAESRDIHLFFWLPSFVATVVIVVLLGADERAGVLGDEMIPPCVVLPSRSLGRRSPEEEGGRERERSLQLFGRLAA